MNKFTPCLWFDGRAEEAMQFYTAVFKDSKAGGVKRYGEHGHGATGSVMTAWFSLFGQDFLALNGGPMFQFTPAISLMVNCEDQTEVDHYWEKLSEGGEKQPCGWLKDKFGVSWQIVPKAMGEMMRTATPAQTEKIMGAMMQMKKIEIDKLKQAAGQA